MPGNHLKYADLTSKVIGCSFTVHNILGSGFQELIYQKALEIEMRHSQISFTREHEMSIYYKSEIIGSRRVHFLINGIIALELKAISKLEEVHFAQAMNYLEVYNLEIGLLINFGEPSVNFKWFTNKKYKSYPTIQ